MIFRYDELKECVKEDFERFYKLGFNEKQILNKEFRIEFEKILEETGVSRKWIEM